MIAPVPIKFAVLFLMPKGGGGFIGRPADVYDTELEAEGGATIWRRVFEGDATKVVGVTDGLRIVKECEVRT